MLNAIEKDEVMDVLMPYKKRTLVMVLGMSPAVATETVYALSAEAGGIAACVPTRIVIVTTSVGRDVLESEVLNPVAYASPYRALEAQLKAERRLQADLPVPEVRVPRYSDPESGEEREIEDAHSQADLDALANVLLAEVQQVTSDPEQQLILSLSGGKKGMSHIAGQVMSLCGRPQDRLVHIVPLPKGLERCPTFFFPSADRYGHYYEWPEDDGSTGGCHSSEVRLELATQSYMPLRTLVEDAVGEGEANRYSFEELLSTLSRQFSRGPKPTLTLVLNKRSRTLSVRTAADDESRSSVGLQPQPFAYLWMLALRHGQDGGLPRPMRDEDACQFLALHEAVDKAKAGDIWDSSTRGAAARAWFEVEQGHVGEHRRLLLPDYTRASMAAYFKMSSDDRATPSKRAKLQGQLTSRINTEIKKQLVTVEVNEAD